MCVSCYFATACHISLSTYQDTTCCVPEVRNVYPVLKYAQSGQLTLSINFFSKSMVSTLNNDYN